MWDKLAASLFGGIVAKEVFGLKAVRRGVFRTLILNAKVSAAAYPDLEQEPLKLWIKELSKRLSKRPQTAKKLDSAPRQQEPVGVLDIAGILPLDHTFWLGDHAATARAVQELRLIRAAQGNPPAVTFPFESYQRSGGGRIANVLAWLGSAGQRVGVCGSVGDDQAGRIVLEDLRNNRVDVSNVTVSPGRHTRLVFLAATSRAPAIWNGTTTRLPSQGPSKAD
jgi:hypothetical protein